MDPKLSGFILIVIRFGDLGVSENVDPVCSRTSRHHHHHNAHGCIPVAFWLQTTKGHRGFQFVAYGRAQTTIFLRPAVPKDNSVSSLAGPACFTFWRLFCCFAWTIHRPLHMACIPAQNKPTICRRSAAPKDNSLSGPIGVRVSHWSVLSLFHLGVSLAIAHCCKTGTR
jgi:hypothetical protein